MHMDKQRMKLAILELEADGAEHDGAEIDAYVAKILEASAEELAELHPKSKRGVFANQIDWAKAYLTENKLHEKVGEANGQNIYRITAKGLDALADEKRHQPLGWTNLHPHEVGEADIQRHMASWDRAVPGAWSHVGAPTWLDALRPVKADTYCASALLGYGFRPDILAESNGTHLVVELKCARKYEPLALAEVLHHAHLLSQGLAQLPQPQAVPYVPVLVTQYNAWLRSALEFLRLNGLRDGSIKYVEFTSLRFGNEMILWFDEPFAPWEPSSAPPLPACLSVGSRQWYKISGADTWIAVDHEINGRPALWTVPYLMLTVDRANSRMLMWEGGPTGAGRYILWHAGGSTQVLTV
jgi:Mrr N-terminal domain